MQMIPTATAFYTSKVKSVSDHVQEMAVMSIPVLMLETLSVSHLCPFTKEISLGQVWACSPVLGNKP